MSSIDLRIIWRKYFITCYRTLHSKIKHCNLKPGAPSTHTCLASCANWATSKQQRPTAIKFTTEFAEKRTKENKNKSRQFWLLFRCNEEWEWFERWLTCFTLLLQYRESLSQLTNIYLQDCHSANELAGRCIAGNGAIFISRRKF